VTTHLDILQFDQYLGAYPLLPTEQQPINTYQRWLHLISYVTPDLASRILPHKSGKVSAITSVSRFSDVPLPDFTPSAQRKDKMDTSGEKDRFEDSPEAKAALEELKLYFTEVDLKRSFPPNATPAEITQHSLDKTYLLKKTIKEEYGGSK
jgi:A1 cistron-splicing factor AAR2